MCEEFVLSVFEGLDFVKCVLILCVGIIMYLLLCIWNVGLGSCVGVIGLGGLGYMVIKIVVVMGVYVMVISCSDKKK